MIGRVLAWGVAFFLLGTSGLQAATMGGTSAYSLSSVTNASSKSLLYKATQVWGTTGVSTTLLCMPIPTGGLAAGAVVIG